MTRWFRVYNDLVDDPKVQRLDPHAVQGADQSRGVWHRQTDGVLPAIDEIAFKLRMKPEKAAERSTIYATAGLVDR